MKKGITPVVAVVLLISLTVTATGTVYFYVNTATPNTDEISNFETALDVKFESCWQQGTEYHYSIRNTNDAAFNSSEVNVFINNRPVDNPVWTQDVVDSRETVQLQVPDVDSGDQLILSLGGDEATEVCRN
jgi:flagellin-like protein